MKKVLIYLLAPVLLFTSCHKSVTYDYQANLESFIMKSGKLDITSSDKNSVILILQNEDCICTEQDVALAKSVLTSPKYAKYRFVVIVSSMRHKFLKQIPSSVRDRVTVIDNKNTLLMDSGYIAVTDRIIVYSDGRPSYFADMHVTKPNLIAREVL